MLYQLSYTPPVRKRAHTQKVDGMQEARSQLRGIKSTTLGAMPHGFNRSMSDRFWIEQALLALWFWLPVNHRMRRSQVRAGRLRERIAGTLRHTDRNGGRMFTATTPASQTLPYKPDPDTLLYPSRYTVTKPPAAFSRY